MRVIVRLISITPVTPGAAPVEVQLHVSWLAATGTVFVPGEETSSAFIAMPEFHCQGGATAGTGTWRAGNQTEIVDSDSVMWCNSDTGPSQKGSGPERTPSHWQN